MSTGFAVLEGPKTYIGRDKGNIKFKNILLHNFFRLVKLLNHLLVRVKLFSKFQLRIYSWKILF